MEIVEPHVSPELIARIKGNVIQRLGYEPGAAVHAEVQDLLDEFESKAGSLFRPRGAYRLLPVVDAGDKEVRVEDGLIRSHMFSRLLRACQGERRIMFMIATAGDESWKDAGPDGSILAQYFFDSLGSELAERAADLVEEHWRTELDGLGLQASQRFSPGYCDWELQGQGLVFDVLDGEKVGVRLNPYFVMNPAKSISSVSVVAREVPYPAPCVFCKKDCPWRRSESIIA